MGSATKEAYTPVAWSRCKLTSLHSISQVMETTSVGSTVMSGSCLVSLSFYLMMSKTPIPLPHPTSL